MKDEFEKAVTTEDEEDTQVNQSAAGQLSEESGGSDSQEDDDDDDDDGETSSESEEERSEEQEEDELDGCSGEGALCWYAATIVRRRWCLHRCFLPMLRLVFRRVQEVLGWLSLSRQVSDFRDVPKTMETKNGKWGYHVNNRAGQRCRRKTENYVVVTP